METKGKDQAEKRIQGPIERRLGYRWVGGILGKGKVVLRDVGGRGLVLGRRMRSKKRSTVPSRAFLDSRFVDGRRVRGEGSRFLQGDGEFSEVGSIAEGGGSFVDLETKKGESQRRGKTRTTRRDSRSREDGERKRTCP